MRVYVLIADQVCDGELQVLIEGPGLTVRGRPWRFCSLQEAKALILALNFAYTTGFRDAFRQNRYNAS